jgi:hypothetical protein
VSPVARFPRAQVVVAVSVRVALHANIRATRCLNNPRIGKVDNKSGSGRGGATAPTREDGFLQKKCVLLQTNLLLATQAFVLWSIFGSNKIV